MDYPEAFTRARAIAHRTTIADHAAIAESTSTENKVPTMPDNHITDSRARKFVAALRSFEQSSDPAPLNALFAPDATLTRLDARGERGDVAAFWREYRAQFHELSTTFSNIVEGVDEFALEWVSTATLTGDRPITYRGVTIIDLDGPRIVRLRTYYDTAAFTMTPAGTA